MKNNNVFLLALIACFTLSSCSQSITTEPSSAESATVNKQASEQVTKLSPLQSLGVQSVLNADIKTLWSQDFDHYQDNLLLEVSQAISLLSKQNNLNDKSLERLSFYLRIYSSFGPDKDWSEQTSQALNDALLDLQNMDGFYQVSPVTAHLHESYAVALYRLYFLEPLQLHSKEHIVPLARLITLYSNADLTNTPQQKSSEYALWEILRASAILPYEATRKNKAEHLAIYGSTSEVPEALIAFIESKNAVINEDDWPKQNALWALAQYYNVYSTQYWNAYYEKTDNTKKQLDDGEITLPEQQKMTDLDNTIWQSLENSLATKHAVIDAENKELKTLFSIPYVVSTFRGKSSCEEGSLKGRCITPTVEEATPIKHICSDSLFIRAQKMTKEQLDESCHQLISQEAVFHEKLATHHKPVANDFNDKLRVIVFHNASEYNKYGQLTFDINTNNGGMYIEGITQDPDNQATFYSYEHFWVRPKFQVWNLHHEYVHYLDGRFIKYDTFNHFPSHLVWWSEGLAEYISKEDKNPKTFKLLNKTEQDKWLTLKQIFDTEYRDGNEQVYKWSYLATRFMYEKHPQDYRQLAHFLKTDFFNGYKELLDESGEKYQDEFSAWLVDHNENFVDLAAAENPHKPREFYRYTYKDYLQPVHLIETPKHMHWQYWHANALKNKTEEFKK